MLRLLLFSLFRWLLFYLLLNFLLLSLFNVTVVKYGIYIALIFSPIEKIYPIASSFSLREKHLFVVFYSKREEIHRRVPLTPQIYFHSKENLFIHPRMSFVEREREREDYCARFRNDKIVEIEN